MAIIGHGLTPPLGGSNYPWRGEGYGDGWGGGANDHPGWESPIHVASSPGLLVLKRPEEKSRFLIKKSSAVKLAPFPMNKPTAPPLLHSQEKPDPAYLSGSWGFPSTYSCGLPPGQQ
ncbi:hypothetical protein AVEN_143934-1 [Araneus ventricosus]|uniref:Uncharacterized protein n=1 Tax=Araneus ventricosus TaxID=182803 RepID=A0A4Y2L066_ARAVE|nr:hypothetical protein AVEN_143934-1 [Araneus ventricosus]